MTDQHRIRYEAPTLEVHQARLERGFQASDPWTGGYAEPLSFGIWTPEEEY